MATASVSSPELRTTASSARWLQLLLGFIVMMTISSPQYVWTLFTTDFMKATAGKLSDVQWTITLLIVLQTWLAPAQGWLVERFGPKLLIGAGAVLSGLGWIASANISSLNGLYLPYGLLCGIGTGIVYIGIIGLMVKWFPERRGFATGVVAAGYDAKTMVTIAGATMAAVPAALTFDRITNGLTRPFFGWLSDRIGREYTMAIAFILEGIAVFLMLQFRSDPFLLVVLSGLVFFGWGEIFSLFPSTLTDTFGAKHATTNYGFLYMAQGVGSILGAPVAAMIFERTGSWLPVFYTIIGLDILTGILALFVLKGMRQRYLDRAEA